MDAGSDSAEAIERRRAAQGPARAGGSLRRALSARAGRFQALRGWELLGYTRAGDYTRECLGLSARELSDLARVDTALRTLPRVEAALVSGGLPWTKVRLVARAARPEEGGRWIAFARRISVRQLERYVRVIDADSIEGGGAEPDAEDAGRRQVVVMKLRPDTQMTWQFGWRLLRRVAGEALDPGACAEWIAAAVLSALPGVPEDEEEAPPGLRTPSSPARPTKRRVCKRVRIPRIRKRHHAGPMPRPPGPSSPRRATWRAPSGPRLPRFGAGSEVGPR